MSIVIFAIRASQENQLLLLHILHSLDLVIAKVWNHPKCCFFLKIIEQFEFHEPPLHWPKILTNIWIISFADNSVYYLHFHPKNLYIKDRIQILVRILGQWWFMEFKLPNCFEKMLPLRMGCIPFRTSLSILWAYSVTQYDPQCESHCGSSNTEISIIKAIRVIFIRMNTCTGKGDSV